MISGILLILKVYGKREKVSQDITRETNPYPNISDFYDTHYEKTPEASRFVHFVQENEANMGSVEFINKGVIYLSDALASINSKKNKEDFDVELDYRLKNLKEYAAQINKEQRSFRNSIIIRKTFISAAEIVNQMQPRYFPELDAQIIEIKKAARGFNSNLSTLSQRKNTYVFFSRMSFLLQSTARNS